MASPDHHVTQTLALQPLDGRPRVRFMSRELAMRLCACAVVLAPLVTVAVVLSVGIGPTFVNGIDNAVNELRLRDLGSHAVLLGPYSRDGWSHPGPAMYLVLLPFYLLAGKASIGMHLGAVFVNASALMTIVLLARRCGGRSLLLLTTLGMSGLLWHLGPAFISSPWNPLLPVLPFGAFIMCCWAAVCGVRWMIPVAVALASFCVQTHVGYLPLTLPLIGWAAVCVAWRARRGRSRACVREFAVAGVVGAVLWLPPVIQQLTAHRGNLSALWSYFRHPSQAMHSLKDSYAVVAHELSWEPYWLHRLRPNMTHFHASTSATVAPLLLGAFALASALMWRRGPAAARALFGALAVSLVAGLISIWRTPGILQDYRLEWLPMLSLLMAIATAWFIWLGCRRALETHVRVLRVAGAVSVLVASIGISAVNVADSGRTRATDLLQDGTDISRLVATARRALPIPRGQVVVVSYGPLGELLVPATVLSLERSGYDARVPDFHARRRSQFIYDDSELLYGAHRVCTGDAAAMLIVRSARSRREVRQVLGYRQAVRRLGPHRFLALHLGPFTPSAAFPCRPVKERARRALPAARSAP